MIPVTIYGRPEVVATMKLVAEADGQIQSVVHHHANR